MIDLRSGRITDILPKNLSSQLEVQAFGYALHCQIVKLCDMADKVNFLTAIQEAPDEILDYLAIELRTPCYKMEYPTEVKRSLILSTLPYYMKMGTTYMVNSIIQTIFGNGHIIEFFDAGLNNLVERTYDLEQKEALLEARLEEHEKLYAEKLKVANHRIEDLERGEPA